MTPLLARNARIAALRPNWNAPVRQSLEFKTDIITSRDGTEQRSAIRKIPRAAISYDSAVRQDQITRHQADVLRANDDPFLVRAEWTAVRIAQDAAAGANVIVVSEVPIWLVAGAEIVVTSETREEHFTVLSVTGATVGVSGVLGGDVATGSVLHLAYFARPTQTEFRARTDSVWTAKPRFEVVPSTNKEPSMSGAGLVFEGREVLREVPNWSRSPRVSVLQATETFDPGFGVTYHTTHEAADHLRLQLGFSALSKTRATRLIDFFIRHKGRRSSFWMPTFNRAFVPSATAMPGANQFKVDGSDFREVYGGNPVFGVMIATWDDGLQQINRIASVDGTADSEITFVDDWRYPVTPATKIQWLLQWRFDSDILEADWHTQTVAEMQIPVRTVYQSPGNEPQVKAVALESVNTITNALRAEYPGGIPLAARGVMVPLSVDVDQVQEVLDLHALGLSQAEIDAGTFGFAVYWKGRSQLTTGADATVRILTDFTFHSTYPVAFNSAALTPSFGGATIGAWSVLTTGDFEYARGLGGIPAGTRYVQVRPRYDLGANEECLVEKCEWMIFW